MNYQISELAAELEKRDAELKRFKAELEEARDKASTAEQGRQAMLLMLEDLNEATADIKTAKKEWETTFDGIADPLFIHDREFKIVRANRAYADAAVMEFKEFIGRPYYEAFPKMDGPFKMCLKAMETQEKEEEEVLLPSGKILKMYFYPILDESGKYLYSAHIIKDITEAKTAEEAIRKSEARLNEAQRIAHIGSWELDLGHNVLTWSNEIYRIFEVDLKQAKVAYETFLEMVHPDDRAAVDSAYTNSLKNRTPYAIDHRLLFSDGRIKHVHEQCETFYDADGKPLRSVGTVQDITEANKMAEGLRQETEVISHLLMISEVTSGTTDIDKLMEQVVHCSHEIVKCDICLSYLWDDETGVLSPSQEFGLSHNLIPLFKTESLDMKAGFVKEAMKKREPVFLSPSSVTLSEAKGLRDSSVASLPQNDKSAIFPWLSDINTIALIPLIGRKGPLGLIVGIYQAGEGLKPAPTIEEREMKVMKGISHQVSIALEEARLFKESVDRAMELSHRIETIKTMHEIDRSILSALDPKEILETATRLVAKVIPCDRATVVNLDRERQAFSWGAGFGTPFLEGLGSAPLEETSAAEVVKTGRTEYVANLLDIKEPLPVEKGLIKEGFLSHIRVPIVAKGEVSGILAIGAKRPSAFTPKNLSTLEYLGAQIGVALENARLITDLRELFLGTVKTLSSTIDAKSPWTAGHSERVTKYALQIGKEMGLSEKELKDLELAGLLHDVGKIGTFEYILDKPGALNDDEKKIMRQHPGKGAKILMSIKQLMPIIPAIKYHHEFYDGTGYPDGLLGTAIPLFARILTVADTVDAMGADRPYRKGRAMDVIVAELKRCSGTQFDSKVVEAFLKIAGEGLKTAIS